jgi:hypothetical protein
MIAPTVGRGIHLFKSRLNRERGEQDLFAIGELPWRRGFCVCHLQPLHGLLSMLITKTRGELWGVSSSHDQSRYTNFEEQKDYTRPVAVPRLAVSAISALLEL